MILSRTRIYPPSLHLDRKSAELKLALLKENFAYRDYFDKLRDDPQGMWPAPLKQEEPFEDYSHRTKRVDRNQHFVRVCHLFGINRLALSWGMGFAKLDEPAHRRKQ